MKRIQRKRSRDWKMPPNTVYVGRPTKWGNPYKLDGFLAGTLHITTREEAIYCYEAWLRKKLLEQPHFLDELKGKDLACWCPLDKSCHADVILKIIEEMRK